MTYKKDDYVRIRHTDFPEQHKVGEIHRVLEAEESYLLLETPHTSFPDGLTYYYHEVEPAITESTKDEIAVVDTIVEADTDPTLGGTPPTKISFRFELGNEKDEEFHTIAMSDSVTPEDALVVISTLLKGR